jgi:competence protein ComEA
VPARAIFETRQTPEDRVLPDSERPQSIPPRPELRELAPTLADRVRTWWSDPRVRFAALAVAAVLAGVIWYRIGAAGSSSQRATSSPAGEVSASSTTTVPVEPAAGSEVVVQVAGAVVHPGVVRLTKGARVTDAIEHAGGGLPGADLERLNLAAKLVDGERIAVPKIGEQLAPAVGPGSDGAPGTGAGAPSAAAPLNLNTATEAQLEALPGVGPTLAAAILAERDKRGGFTSVNDLRSVHGIGDRRFADLKDLVAV